MMNSARVSLIWGTLLLQHTIKGDFRNDRPFHPSHTGRQRLVC